MRRAVAQPAYLFATEFLLHDPPAARVEVRGQDFELGREDVSNALLTELADRLIGTSGAIEGMERPAVRPATTEELIWLHDPAYLRRVKRACEGGPWDADAAAVTPGSWIAATMAAGASIDAARLVTAGNASWALVNTRPTGHHAERDRGMGGCFLNNGGLAAEAARRAGAERVMIVDWDVHIGNGAERLFWERGDVLAISIHQDGWYPRDAGSVSAAGSGAGRGHTVNVPLPPAVNDAGYVAAIEQVVRPVALAYRPDLIVVAAGQDPAIFDPMGRMAVSTNGFRAMARAVAEISQEICDGRLVCTIEGGYSQLYTPLCVLAVLEGLADRPETVPDPFAGDAELDLAGGPMSRLVGQAINAVRNVHPGWFRAWAPSARLLTHP